MDQIPAFFTASKISWKAQPTIRLISHRDGTMSFQQCVETSDGWQWTEISIVNDSGEEIGTRVQNIYVVK